MVGRHFLVDAWRALARELVIGSMLLKFNGVDARSRVLAEGSRPRVQDAGASFQGHGG